jgi:hypothetical protein
MVDSVIWISVCISRYVPKNSQSPTENLSVLLSAVSTCQEGF